MRVTSRLSVITLMLLVSLVLVPDSMAQTEEQLARFEEERVAFFTRELQLSETESEHFWPLYNDFDNRRMKISEEERNTLRYYHNNYENMSEQEISEILTKYVDLNNQKHILEREYHNKFREILPDKKVMMLYVVERQFRMHLIRRLREPGTGMGQGGPHRGGKGPRGDMEREYDPLPMPEIAP
jgi:hypothetical protein